MLIQVIYKNNAHDYVKDFRLDSFIASGKVAKFLRRSGWVTVGVDPIRTKNQSTYDGPERRHVSV